jgi:hydroxyethylthiazole kinase
MSPIGSAGASLARIRAEKPLVHQITNYVVMNETANATLALGALPVMAHAGEEVEEMVTLASALVLNIGTLSPHWVDAMLLAGRAANAKGIPVVVDPVGAGATRYRTETATKLLDEIDVSVVRGNAGEIATLVGVEAEVRGVESIEAASDARRLAAEAGKIVGAAAVTGAVDYISDAERMVAVSNGHPLLGAVSGTGCMATAMIACFHAVTPDDPISAAANGLGAFGVAAEDAARDAAGPGTFHARLYDALANLEPEQLDRRIHIDETVA